MVLARCRFPGKALVDGIVHMPLVLPPVVMGYLLLVTFGTRAPVGAWLLEHFGIRLVFSWTGAALAAAIISFPFQVRAIRLAVEAIDPGLDDAAETLGAGPLDRFLHVTLPLALPGIIAGAITAFAASLGEFGAIITFVSNVPGETRTLPLAIYTAIQTPGGETAAARLAILAILLAVTGLALSEMAARRVRALSAR
jgi:molybdate transport system permease protein